MGEIGAIMARLEEEGLDLEQLIDRELQEVGFLSLANRSKDSLSNRIDSISESQNELKSLFKSIEDQLRLIQEVENIPVNLLDDAKFAESNKQVKHVIVIDDDEDALKKDSSCQAETETTSKAKSLQPTKLPDKTNHAETAPVSTVPPTLALPTPPLNNNSSISGAPPTPQTVQQAPKPTPVVPKASSSQVASPLSAPHTSPLNTPFTQASATTEEVIAYRTLKSPSQKGMEESVVSMVTVKSSQPVPPEYLRGATTPTTPSVSTLDDTPVVQLTSGPRRQPSVAKASNVTSTPKPIICAPPVFKESTRIIGKRSDDLWYPGEIVKVVQDRNNQTKFRVKFDQGNRGLLRSNHIALESHAPKGVLDVGSRVVALRPRETADEGASWRQEKEGPYGKLDVLYAGIVAEKSCPDTKNRFLIFFDDGFAQYLPLNKLHHVYNTGDKVWNEVAEHSQEFIQEYLEEYPNRPMVVLRANQWVKTEWRGKWLKAKVMQVDCSLVKMLFQVDNRTEWIYRGSTRLEPLFKALVDGKISQKKSSKKRKQIQDEPYVDFSATKPQFGSSAYSKTDPKGTMKSSSSTQTQTSVGNTPSNTSSSVSTTSTPPSQEPPAKSATLGTQTQTQAQTQTLLAVKALKRIAHKVHDGQMCNTGTMSLSSKTGIDVRGAPMNSLPLVKANTSPLPDNTISPSWTTNNYSADFAVNHFSSTNHYDDSTASIIHASTMRKRTSAGLHVDHKAHLIDGGPNVVDNRILNGIIPKIGVSPKKKWEAPWKRTSQADTQVQKEVIVKTKLNDSKHDAAALIQERLQAQKKLERSLNAMPELQSLIPKPPVLGPHKCGKPCGQSGMISRENKSKHNVLALPLLLHWKREIARRHPKGKKDIYYRAPCNKRLRSLGDVARYLLQTGTCNVSIDQFCFDPEISCSDVLHYSKNIILSDISQGQEPVAISVFNDQDDNVPPDIDYVSDRILSEGVHINTEPGFLACCDCTDNCQDKTKCSCAQLTISASAAVDGKVDNTVGYEYRRLMDTVPTGIYECNQNCACSNQCFNRVVQNGIQLRLQVFKTENRGWGLRTMDDIPIGTFICTYSGQIMNEDMANKEGRDFGDEYLAELDHIEVVEKIKEGYESSVSDLEDDSVIYNTLQTENSSEQSETGSISGYGFMSDSDSDDSNSSHSSYSPRAKKSNLSKKKPSDSVKITEADGTSFSVTMADEKCVMAISSGKSIVLRRLGETDQSMSPKVKQENQSNVPNLQKDPPPMPKPAIIDLTSDDDDLINCSTNNSISHPFKNAKSDMDQTKNTFSAHNDSEKRNDTNNSKTISRTFTDFKIFDLTDENMDTSDVIDSCHDKSDVNDKDAKLSVVKEFDERDIKNDNAVDKKGLEPDNDKGLGLLEDKSSSLLKDISRNSSSCKVTKSVCEVTKQEEMEVDPCLREDAPQPTTINSKSSSSINTDKKEAPKGFLDNDRHGDRLNDHLKEKNDPQITDIHDSKDSLQSSSCHNNKHPQGNSSHNNSRSIQGDDDASHCCGNNVSQGNKEKKSDTASDSNIAKSDGESIDGVTRESNHDNGSQGNINNINDKSRSVGGIDTDDIKDELEEHGLGNEFDNRDNDGTCESKNDGQVSSGEKKCEKKDDQEKDHLKKGILENDDTKKNDIKDDKEEDNIEKDNLQKDDKKNDEGRKDNQEINNQENNVHKKDISEINDQEINSEKNDQFNEHQEKIRQEKEKQENQDSDTKEKDDQKNDRNRKADNNIDCDGQDNDHNENINDSSVDQRTIGSDGANGNEDKTRVVYVVDDTVQKATDGSVDADSAKAKDGNPVGSVNADSAKAKDGNSVDCVNADGAKTKDGNPVACVNAENAKAKDGNPVDCVNADDNPVDSVDADGAKAKDGNPVDSVDADGAKAKDGNPVDSVDTDDTTAKDGNPVDSVDGVDADDAGKLAVNTYIAVADGNPVDSVDADGAKAKDGNPVDSVEGVGADDAGKLAVNTSIVADGKPVDSVDADDAGKLAVNTSIAVADGNPVDSVNAYDAGKLAVNTSIAVADGNPVDSVDADDAGKLAVNTSIAVADGNPVDSVDAGKLAVDTSIAVADGNPVDSVDADDAGKLAVNTSIAVTDDNPVDSVDVIDVDTNDDNDKKSNKSTADIDKYDDCNTTNNNNVDNDNDDYDAGNDKNDDDDDDAGVSFELRMEIDDSMESNEGQLSTSLTESTGTTKSTKREDKVPSLMSVDDLSKLAAKIHQPHEQPPTLTKMNPAHQLTADLHDTIAKLQSRGVAADVPVNEQPDEDSVQSLDDLPLFTSGCDSFPPSPASSRSESWISDSVEKSSEASDEAKSRSDRLKNDGRRARRFIVTLQKSGHKRSASPDGTDGGPYKRPSTRSLFNNEEHCYVIDAKAYGNCGRFLNHSCSPNLFVQNVFINTHDLRFPHVAFFAQHNIRAGSELTWDYMYEVGSVQDKVLRCYCGSSQCRGRLL